MTHRNGHLDTPNKRLNDCEEIANFLGVESEVVDVTATPPDPLRSEIVSADSKLRCAAACTTSLARSGSGNAHNACEKARALIDRRLGRGNSQKRGASGAKPKSSKLLSMDENSRFPSPPLRVITSKTATQDRQT